MRVGEQDARNLFMALGYTGAHRWPSHKLVKRLNVIHCVPVPEALARPSHPYNTLLRACLKACHYDRPIVLDAVTHYEDAQRMPVHKERPNVSLYPEDNTVAGDTLDALSNNRRQRGLNAIAARALANHADENGWPTAVDPNKVAEDVKRMVKYDKGRDVSTETALNATYKARAVLHAYFTRLQEQMERS